MNFAILADGIDGIIEYIEKDLLNLGRIADRFREFLRKVGFDLNVLIAGIVFQKTDRFSQYLVDIDLLLHRFHAPCKAQQSMDHLLGPLDVVFDFRHGILKFRKVFTLCDILLHKQILDPADFFLDDRQRIVHFVSDARRHLSQGGHFARLHQACIQNGLFPIGPNQLLQYGTRNQNGSRGDQQNAPDDQHDRHIQRVEKGQQLHRRVLLNDQQPFLVLEGCGGQKYLAAVGLQRFNASIAGW